MRFLNKLSLFICLFFLVFTLAGCSGANSYANNEISWDDVTNKFIELEKEKADIMNILQGKLSNSPAAPPS